MSLMRSDTRAGIARREARIAFVDPGPGAVILMGALLGAGFRLDVHGAPPELEPLPGDRSGMEDSRGRHRGRPHWDDSGLGGDEELIAALAEARANGKVRVVQTAVEIGAADVVIHRWSDVRRTADHFRSQM